MEVKSQIKAIVWKIIKQPGDMVEIDDEIIILESMKMEITVESPTDGLVHSILKAEGELVKTGGMLLLLKTKTEEDS